MTTPGCTSPFGEEGGCDYDALPSDSDDPVSGFPSLRTRVGIDSDTFSIDSSVVEMFSEEETAKITIRLINTSSTATEVSSSYSAPLSQFQGTDGSNSVYIVPEGVGHVSAIGASKVDIEGNGEDATWCFKTERIAAEDVGFESELGPCEDISQTYLVYDSMDSGACFQRGSYTFEDTIHVEGDGNVDLNLKLFVEQ